MLTSKNTVFIIIRNVFICDTFTFHSYKVKEFDGIWWIAHSTECPWFIHGFLVQYEWFFIFRKIIVVIIFKTIDIYILIMEKGMNNVWFCEVTSCRTASILIYTYHMKFSAIFYFRCTCFLLPYFSISFRVNHVIFLCFIIFKILNQKVCHLSCIVKPGCSNQRCPFIVL